MGDVLQRWRAMSRRWHLVLANQRNVAEIGFHPQITSLK
jgi:hypothetical protein